jgi:hypothetical protein
MHHNAAPIEPGPLVSGLIASGFIGPVEKLLRKSHAHLKAWCPSGGQIAIKLNNIAGPQSIQNANRPSRTTRGVCCTSVGGALRVQLLLCMDIRHLAVVTSFIAWTPSC